MSVLKELLESRDAAQAAYDEFVNPLIEAAAELTDEQNEKRAELRSAVEKLDERIDEEHAKVTRAAKLNEVRASINAGPQPATGVEVVHEPTVYGKGSEHSYFLDLIHAGNLLDPANGEARARLQQASHEAAVEMVSNKNPEKRRRIRTMLAEEHRSAGRDNVREAIKRYEALGATGRGELRTGMDTTSGSGGSFATPVYFVQEYAPYREAGRAFADQCNKQDLPAYGMTVYIPHVTGPAGIASQSSQNTGVQETDPTAGYLSANLSTYAGEVTVSQQLLDRAGPGFPFDRMVFDQLTRDYAPKIDTAVLTAALANAGTVAYTSTAAFQLTGTSGNGGFYSKISGAKAAIRTGAGVFLNPTHLFTNPSRWEVCAAWSDAQGRPVIVPNYAGAFNAVAAGNENGDVGVEGSTGYRLNGLSAFTDNNIPSPTAGNDQAIVGDLSEVYVFEGEPVPRVLPQTLASNLSVILQMYSYLAVIVRYPTAVQTIAGTGMSAPAF